MNNDSDITNKARRLLSFLIAEWNEKKQITIIAAALQHERDEMVDVLPSKRNIDPMENRGDLFSEGYNTALEQCRAAIRGNKP
jgi:hypothetical protein